MKPGPARVGPAPFGAARNNGAGRNGGEGPLARTTQDLDDALAGAAFVDKQIRMGGNRHRVQDRRIPLRYGLIVQENTGALVVDRDAAEALDARAGRALSPRDAAPVIPRGWRESY